MTPAQGGHHIRECPLPLGLDLEPILILRTTCPIARLQGSLRTPVIRIGRGEPVVRLPRPGSTSLTLISTPAARAHLPPIAPLGPRRLVVTSRPAPLARNAKPCPDSSGGTDAATTERRVVITTHRVLCRQDLARPPRAPPIAPSRRTTLQAHRRPGSQTATARLP